jgi:hypothetical protein
MAFTVAGATRSKYDGGGLLRLAPEILDLVLSYVSVTRDLVLSKWLT